jgi:hypothetical protein
LALAVVTSLSTIAAACSGFLLCVAVGSLARLLLSRKWRCLPRGHPRSKAHGGLTALAGSLHWFFLHGGAGFLLGSHHSQPPSDRNFQKISSWLANKPPGRSLCSDFRAKSSPPAAQVPPKNFQAVWS